MSHKLHFEALNALTSGADANAPTLIDRLRGNVTRAETLIEEAGLDRPGKASAEETDVHRRFISLSFRLLRGIVPSSEEEMWSVKDSMTAKRTIQLVVAFGILPRLRTGVGIPLERRTEFGVKFVDAVDEGGFTENLQCLAHVSESLLRLCLSDAKLAKLIVESHFSDLLASLIQVGHEPLKIPRGFDSDRVQQLKDVKLAARRNVARATTELSAPFVMEELLLMVRASSADTSSPAWYRKTLYQLLSSSIARPKGFLHLVASVTSNSSSSSTEAQRFDAVAELVATPPGGGAKFDATLEYLAPVCCQILQLLDAGSSDASRVRLAANCALRLYDKYPGIAETFLIRPATAPFLAAMDDEKLSPVSESLVGVVLFRLAAFASIPKSTSGEETFFVRLVRPIVGLLLQMYAFVKDGVLVVKETLRETLTTYFKTIAVDEAVEATEEFLYLGPRSCPRGVADVFVKGEKRAKAGRYLTDRLSFGAGENGGVAIVAASTSLAPDAEAVISTAATLAHGIGLEEELLLRLMERMSEEVSEDVAAEGDSVAGVPVAKILTLRAIDHLCRSLDPSSANFDRVKMATFVRLTCERYLVSPLVLRETVPVALGLVSVILLTRSFEGEDVADAKTDFRCLTPILQRTASADDPEIAEMARETLALLDERVEDSSRRVAPASEPPSQFRRALKELEDPLVPVKGHALLALAKLVDAKDPEVCRAGDRLLEIFSSFLEEGDAYLYLNAVRGLEALASAFPSVVIPRLCREFHDLSARSDEASFRRRINICESVCRTCRRLANMAPTYAPVMLNCLLAGVRDPDAHVRASCLSALAELLRQMRYSLGSEIYETLATLGAAAKLDADVEVRRAAVLAVRNILEGVGVDVIDALGDAVAELYRLVKFVHATDADDVVRLHAQIALEILDDSMRRLLFPERKLEKRISLHI